ncbi:hypothetical protein [Metabacillus endolithicus]|uniref:Uncharacterized protein n=1 Tax=Metabacillus endolithicus TaxID=1535204 RepID=A0ABW5BTB2_9BACI|nr:hypothetical protein [Metabacillus endolithicus]UPG63793.1 hypothetical protein MVE64_01055 [Metabacillus endolithicus]
MNKEQGKPTYYDGSGNSSLSPTVLSSNTYVIKPKYDKKSLIKYPYFPYMGKGEEREANY